MLPVVWALLLHFVSNLFFFFNDELGRMVQNNDRRSVCSTETEPNADRNPM